MTVPSISDRVYDEEQPVSQSAGTAHSGTGLEFFPRPGNDEHRMSPVPNHHKAPMGHRDCAERRSQVLPFETQACLWMDTPEEAAAETRATITHGVACAFLS